MAYMKAVYPAMANLSHFSHESTLAVAVVEACREEDAQSTSASSGHEQGGSDIHALSSSDDERETALQQSKMGQHQTIPANAPWRQGNQWQQQRQPQPQPHQQRIHVSNKMEQPRAPPGLPPPSATGGGKAKFKASTHPGFKPPPGLQPPPGFELPPGLPVPATKPAAFEYTAQAFRRELASTMRELRLHKNVGLAVVQVRACCVPCQRQAAEFADILTLAAEETRGPARRSFMAFVGGITKAFEMAECIRGLRMFFDDVYPQLCTEVSRLPKIVMTELLPTLKSVLPDGELIALQPLLDAARCCNA